MSLPSDTFFRFQANQYLILLLRCMLSEEATNTNFIIFGLTQQGFKHMNYHAQGEHNNH